MAEPWDPEDQPARERPEPGRPAGGAAPEDAVRREARLLAAALAATLRAQARPEAPAAAEDGEPPPDRGAGHDDPPQAARRPEGAPRTDSAALSEVLAGAGLMARGGLELMGGVMSRLVEVSANPPEPAGSAAGGGGGGADGEPDGVERGQARVARYRRTQRREVPVIDDPGRTDLE